MKNGKKSYSKQIEHYILPVGLFLLNIGIIHLIHTYYNHEIKSTTYILVVTLAVLALGTGIYAKHKNLIIVSSIIYMIIFVLQLLGFFS